MIHGKIETYRTQDGGKLYRGACRVTSETVTAGEVMANQLPDGPSPGFERQTLHWVNITDARGGSWCEFEIHDKPIA